MDHETKAIGRPLGPAVEDWRGAAPPDPGAMEGRHVRLEPFDPEAHAGPLHAAFDADRDGRGWTYLPYGPFESPRSYAATMADLARSGDTFLFAIVDRTRSCPVGVASWLRAFPAHGSIEVGHLHYAPALRRTPAGTEAMYLMMRRVFEEWGYRRYEWKCDALNAPSRAAAERLGFRYEGTFRQHAIVKGRSRDTAWFSILDHEWPGIRDALEAWLAPSNFGADGRQRRPLGAWMPESAGRPVVEDR